MNPECINKAGCPHDRCIPENCQSYETADSLSRPPSGSAWQVDYDMFERDDFAKKGKIAQRLNDGWLEMGMLPWVVEGKHAGFHVWWKRQNAGGEN